MTEPQPFEDLDEANAEVARLREREMLYCPLAREANVDNARLRALVGEDRPEDEPMLTAEATQLHREREWATERLAEEMGVSLADVRILMRREFGSPEAFRDRLSTET
jgi:hypothetical protein